MATRVRSITSTTTGPTPPWSWPLRRSPQSEGIDSGDTYARLAAGFGIGIGIATAYRYIREAVEVPAVLAPTPAEATCVARTKAFVILDGTLLPMDRIAVDTPYYSGKHKRHGMNIQVLTDPFGRLLWASPALPGSTHDLTAVRTHGTFEALTAADLKCCADKAYQGTGRPVRVPFRGHRLKRWQRRHNNTHAKIRCLGERAMATLKGRRLLRKQQVVHLPQPLAGTRASAAGWPGRPR